MKLRAAPSLLFVFAALSAFTLSACTSSGHTTVVQPLTPISSYAVAGGPGTAVTTGTFDLSICEEVQAVSQAASDGRELSAAMATRLRFVFVDAHRVPPFGADPQLAADLPLSNETVRQLAPAEADCKRLGYVFAIPALPAQPHHKKPSAAAVWALLVATLLAPLLVGLGLWAWRSNSLRSQADPEHDAYVGRMAVAGARVTAIALAAWTSGPKLADLMGWSRPATVGMVASVATVLVGIYVVVIRRRLAGTAVPSASGGYLYLLGLTAAVVLPWLVGGLGGAIFNGVGSRIGAAILAAVISVAALWFVIPWLTIAMLTTPCAPDIDAAVLELCKRLGQPIRAARLIAFKGRPLAYAAVVGAQTKTRYIIVSEDLVQNLSSPQFAATVAHEIGHLAAVKRPRRTLVFAAIGITYTFAFMAFASGILPLLIPITITVQAGFSNSKQRREFAADAFAASACGAADMEAALTRIGEVNGVRLDASTVTYPGATHPHLAARITALRAAAMPAPGDASAGLTAAPG